MCYIKSYFTTHGCVHLIAKKNIFFFFERKKSTLREQIKQPFACLKLTYICMLWVLFEQKLCLNAVFCHLVPLQYLNSNWYWAWFILHYYHQCLFCFSMFLQLYFVVFNVIIFFFSFIFLLVDWKGRIITHDLLFNRQSMSALHFTLVSSWREKKKWVFSWKTV